MYYGRIEAAPIVVAPLAPAPSTTSIVTGLVVLSIGLPLLAARVFLYGIGRSLAKLGALAAIIGEATLEAARKR